MNKESRKLFERIRSYLTVFMPKQRGASEYTIKSYKETINQFLEYVSKNKGIDYSSVTFQDWSADMISNYLVYLEDERKVSAATRNQRLYAIRSFLKYARISNPELVSLSMEAASIPAAREEREPVEFLSEAAMATLLRQPDPAKKIELRDMTFMIVMYDTAARDCEMLNLKVDSIDIYSAHPKARLDGKGNKVRYVPLMQKTVMHLKRYMQVFHANPKADDWLFYTVAHGQRNKMSDDNVARFLMKYVRKGRLECNEIPEKVTPHQFRHTRAMHLYRNGLQLQLLAEYMGHASVVSTQIYAYADTEMKRKALEKCQKNGGMVENNIVTPEWQSNDDLIKKLYGLD